MRRLIFSTCVVIWAAMMICSCKGKVSQGQGNADSISFDSIKVDTTLSLTKDTSGPRCHVKLCLTYAKGKNADFINDSIIRSGVLSPDFLSITDRHLTMSEAVDSFVSKYLNDYREFYAELYESDKNNGSSYYCEYTLSSQVTQETPNYYTYQANVYNYMGGAHGASLVIVRNINVENGRIVTLKDLFVPGYEKTLYTAIIKSLCKKYEVEDIQELNKKTTIFDGIDVYASENFIISKKGITFIYSPDEIASHAAGEIRAEISNDDIEEILKK